MNRIFQLGLKQEKLMELGLRLGADIPFCVMRGTALAEGVGEILTPLPPMPKCPVLIASRRFPYLQNLYMKTCVLQKAQSIPGSMP